MASIPKNAYPLTHKYEPSWVQQNSVGGNVLLTVEDIAQSLNLKPKMRVLDLACGKAISSIFLAKEFDVEVWAVDKDFSADQNWERIKEQGLENKVFPLQCDARMLPFAADFFDVIICVNSYSYFGTDDKYLAYICHFLKKDGLFAIGDIGLKEEIENTDQIPELLRSDFHHYWQHIHSLDWWVHKFQRTGLLNIHIAAEMPNSQFIKDEYIRYFPDDSHEAFAKALKNDKDGLLHFFKIVGKRSELGAFLERYVSA